MKGHSISLCPDSQQVQDYPSPLSEISTIMWTLFSRLVWFALGFVAATLFTVAVPPAWGIQFPSDAVSSEFNSGNFIPAVSSSSAVTVYSWGVGHGAATTCVLSCGPKNLAAVRVLHSASQRNFLENVSLQAVCVGYTVKTGCDYGYAVYARATPSPASVASLSVDVQTSVDWEGWYWWASVILFFVVFFGTIFIFKR